MDARHASCAAAATSPAGSRAARRSTSIATDHPSPTKPNPPALPPPPPPPPPLPSSLAQADRRHRPNAPTSNTRACACAREGPDTAPYATRNGRNASSPRSIPRRNSPRRRLAQPLRRRGRDPRVGVRARGDEHVGRDRPHALPHEPRARRRVDRAHDRELSKRKRSRLMRATVKNEIFIGQLKGGAIKS